MEKNDFSRHIALKRIGWKTHQIPDSEKNPKSHILRINPKSQSSFPDFENEFQIPVTIPEIPERPGILGFIADLWSSRHSQLRQWPNRNWQIRLVLPLPGKCSTRRGRRLSLHVVMRPWSRFTINYRKMIIPVFYIWVTWLINVFITLIRTVVVIKLYS